MPSFFGIYFLETCRGHGQFSRLHKKYIEPLTSSSLPSSDWAVPPAWFRAWIFTKLDGEFPTGVKVFVGLENPQGRAG